MVLLALVGSRLLMAGAAAVGQMQMVGAVNKDRGGMLAHLVAAP
jgi:hypothetical protein